MELPFRPNKPSRMSYRGVVSILVLMELPFRQGCVVSEYTISLVSILVLMELPFRLQQTIQNELPWRCFNPCFNGIAFSTFLCHRRPHELAKFQSLF